MAAIRDDATTGVALRGLDALSQALRFEDFPTDKQNLYYAVGDLEIQDAGERFVPVRDLLDEIKEDKFMTPRDALQAICRAAEKHHRQAA